MAFPARHRLSKELGRRVSRGEYERMTTRYFAWPGTRLIPYRGKNGQLLARRNFTATLEPGCPKFLRKRPVSDWVEDNTKLERYKDLEKARRIKPRGMGSPL